jgi:hypothetical protein
MAEATVVSAVPGPHLAGLFYGLKQSCCRLSDDTAVLHERNPGDPHSSHYESPTAHNALTTVFDQRECILPDNTRWVVAGRRFASEIVY